MNKVAVITGGSRGLGLAIASELQRRGHDLLLAATDSNGLESARKKLTGKNKVEIVAGDITLAATAALLADSCRTKFGRMDLLVNNAGIFLGGSLDEFDEKSWDMILSVNLKAAFLVSRAALPLLRESKGQIVFINSVGGKIGLKNLSAYSASKFGLRGFADSLRLELRPDEIRVTSIFPHGMNSVGESIPDDDPKRWTMIETADVARMVGEVADSPTLVQIPEIVIYPRSTEISKQEKKK